MDQQLGKLTELITYYRVSDKKQGDGEHSGTGHGIDAQKRDVEFLRQRLGGVVIESYTEVESGGKDDRPMLAEAIAKCKASGATLVVAKLDRLARSTYLIACLQRASIKFICADMPEANELTISLMAAMAEHELRMIRARTKAGLESAKLKGKKLGANGTDKNGLPHKDARGYNDGVKRANKEKSEKARRYYEDFLPRIKLMRENGKTIKQIVAWLNTEKLKTSTGRAWSTSVLYEVMSRYMPDANLLVETV